MVSTAYVTVEFVNASRAHEKNENVENVNNENVEHVKNENVENVHVSVGFELSRAAQRKYYEGAKD